MADLKIISVIIFFILAMGTFNVYYSGNEEYTSPYDDTNLYNETDYNAPELGFFDILKGVSDIDLGHPIANGLIAFLGMVGVAVAYRAIRGQ